MNRFFDGFRFPFLNQDRAYPIEYDNALSSNEYLNKLMQYIKKWIDNANKVLENFDAELEHTSNKSDVVSPSADVESYPTVRAVYEYINRIETEPSLFFIDETYNNFDELWSKVTAGIFPVFKEKDPADETNERQYLFSNMHPFDERFNGKSVTFRYYSSTAILTKIISKDNYGVVEWHSEARYFTEFITDSHYNGLHTTDKTVIGAINEILPLAQHGDTARETILNREVKTKYNRDLSMYNSFAEYWETIPVGCTFSLRSDSNSREDTYNKTLIPTMSNYSVWGIKLHERYAIFIAVSEAGSQYYIGNANDDSVGVVWHKLQVVA